MSIIARKFNDDITALKNSFNTNKDINHSGIKGSFNEDEINELIREIIPKRYIVTSGIIENAEGRQSNETDIIIYDDEILPRFMKKEKSFVPVEAVQYIFEIKSKLDSTELKTTIDKFKTFNTIGGIAPTVLFAYSTDIKGNELERYLKNEGDGFYTNPSINVLCVSDKCYYFKSVEEYYLKDKFSNKEWIEMLKMIDIDDVQEAFRDVMSDDGALSQMSRSAFALLIQYKINFNNQINDINNKELFFNGVKFRDIKFKIHKWVGVEIESNDIELLLLSGISNTLSIGNFGEYLLNNKDLNCKVISVCCEDMWGNVSGKDFNKNGLSYNTDDLSFTYKSNNDTHSIIFKFNTSENV